jgi:hypothetical protein
MNEECFHQMSREVRKTVLKEAVMALDEPITMDELWDSVMRGKPNKAPGEDGINQEYFKVMLGTIKQEMLEVVNQMYNNGISDNQKHGLMVCVQKNSDLPDRKSSAI